MQIIVYLLCIIIVITTTTRPIFALPRATFVDESHNNQVSPRSGFLNATVSLATAIGAPTSHEVTSKRHSGAVFPDPKAAASANVSYPMASSSPVQQSSQWGPDGISTVVFGCIASILGMLAIWATFWLGHRQFSSNSMTQPRLLLPRLTPSIEGPSADNSDDIPLQEVPDHRISDAATAGSSGGRQQHEFLEAPTQSVAGD